MASVEELIIKLTADNSDLKKKLGESEKGVDKFSGVVGKLGPMIAGAFTVGAVVSLGQQMIAVTAKFQTYNAVLKNTLGSQSQATKSMEMIQKFASETPFSVDQLTSSYVKLANQGFKPSQDELIKLGDVASSTGKGFDQLVEGMLDATMGEFERLKEFGIKAKADGDKVIFTFKGVQTQVDNNAASIRAYILGLGDLGGVMGSMAAISKTLEGKISNMGDAWDQFLLSFGKTVSPGVIAGLSDTSAWLTEINNSSGFFNKLMAAINPLHYVIGKTNTQLKAEADYVKESKNQWKDYDLKQSQVGFLKTAEGIKLVAEKTAELRKGSKFLNAETEVSSGSFTKARTSLEKYIDTMEAAYKKAQELEAFNVPNQPISAQVAQVFGTKKEGKVKLAPIAYKPTMVGIDKDAQLKHSDAVYTESLKGEFQKRREALEENLKAGLISKKQYDAEMRKVDSDQTAFAIKTTNSELETQMANMQQMQSLMAGFGEAAATAYGEQSAAAKAFAVGQVIAQAAIGIMGTWAGYAEFGFVGTALAVAQTAMIGGIAMTQIGKISGAFAAGGIVGGSSMSGDNLTARVNSGEMILNGNQQRELFAMANGMGARSQVEVVGYISGDVIRLANKRSTYVANRRG